MSKPYHLLAIALIPLSLAACATAVVPTGGKAGGDTVFICHKGKKTMELPSEAVNAHIGHGDTYGPCR